MRNKYVGAGSPGNHSAHKLVLDLNAAAANRGLGPGDRMAYGNSLGLGLWHDLSGNNHYGILQGYQFNSGSGWRGTRLSADDFCGLRSTDGSNDEHVYFGYHADFDLTDALTLEIWIYAYSTSINQGLIGRSRNNSYFLAGSEGNNQVTAYLGGASFSTPEYLFSGWTPVHLALVKRHDGTAEIYYNAVSQATASGIVLPGDDSSPLLIGKSYDDSSWLYKGVFYAARLYGKALSADEIRRNFHDGFAWKRPVIVVDTCSYPLAAYDVAAVFSAAAAINGYAGRPFAFITDTHYYTGDGSLCRTLGTLGALSRGVKLDFIAHGGDVIADNPLETALTEFADIKQRFAAACPGVPLYPVKGNHDDQTIYDISYVAQTAANVVYPSAGKIPSGANNTTAQTFANFFCQDVGGGRIAKNAADPGSLYYYYDQADSKIRFIFLDTVDIPYILGDTSVHASGLRYAGEWDYGFSGAQLDWLAHTALNFAAKGSDAANWGVVFISHVPPAGSLSYTGDTPVTNADVFLATVQAFIGGAAYTSPATASVYLASGGSVVTKTTAPWTDDFAQAVSVDFSSQGAMEVICHIHGHVHTDQTNAVDGVTYVATANAVNSQSWTGAPERAGDTVTETVFDVFNIDRGARKIYATRIGAGSSRTISY
jgi:Calcineurin-like phosphoesterase.